MRDYVEETMLSRETMLERLCWVFEIIYLCLYETHCAGQRHIISSVLLELCTTTEFSSDSFQESVPAEYGVPLSYWYWFLAVLHRTVQSCWLLFLALLV